MNQMQLETAALSSVEKRHKRKKEGHFSHSFPKAYTFDDICLVPQLNKISSRLHTSLRSNLTRKCKLGIPLLCANMDTVIGEELASILIKNGSIPIYHRFTKNLELEKEWVKKFRFKTFVSCGINEMQMEKIDILFQLGAIGVCIDIAHGHSELAIRFIEKVKKTYPDKEVIAGNICSPAACYDLINVGVDALKVGIGPGAACTTRMVTGFGVPQFSAIFHCGKVAKKFSVPLIADGGIRTSRDIVLALAAGASSVMIGKLFALTLESAAEKRKSPIDSDQIEAKYRGQASQEFQLDYFGGLKEKTVAEGESFWAPISGNAQHLIDKLLGGIRSGLTYGGAKDIEELQDKAEFLEVTSSYIHESSPRK